MRTNGTLRYILGDHLGSTSLTTDANGQNTTKIYYKAWGEVRYASGNTPTQYTFTGQFSYVNDFGLMFYNARWLDVSLGRFAQADTIIPLGQGIQAWDRYAYTNNNPLRYTDPSGHWIRAAVTVAAVVITGSFILSAVGATPDYYGAAITMAFADTDNAVVAAGLTVQSQYPWSMFMGSGLGMSQIKQDKIDDLLEPDGQDPFSPSVAVEAMEELIGQATTQCELCTTGADKLVVAALAQNNFNPSLFKNLTRNSDGTLNWELFLQEYGGNPSAIDAKVRQGITGRNYETQLMLKIYLQDLRLLMRLGYDLPEGITEEDLKFVEDNYLE